MMIPRPRRVESDGPPEGGGPREIAKEGGSLIVIHHPRIVRSTLACLMVAVGLAGLAAGCGGTASTATAPGVEEVPEGIAKAKEAMKERAAAARKGRPGGAPARH